MEIASTCIYAFECCGCDCVCGFVYGVALHNEWMQFCSSFIRTLTHSNTNQFSCWSRQKIDRARDKSVIHWKSFLFHHCKFQWKIIRKCTREILNDFLFSFNSLVSLSLASLCIDSFYAIRESMLRFDATHMWWMEVDSSFALGFFLSSLL